jgi:cobyrinic acid a,c-diamide synthase
MAKLLHAPVILVVDCDKVTRTAAAMVLGCRHLDPEVDIRGVILNRVSGTRHAAVIRQSIECYCNLPVFGTIPRMKDLPLTERHLGLIPPQEHGGTRAAMERIGAITGDCLNLKGLMEIAENAPSWRIDAFPHLPAVNKSGRNSIKVGIIQDTAFQFYYHENVEALLDAGAEIVLINALEDRSLPDIDCLYIGGGFPETQVQGLSENKEFRRSLKEAAENGLPIYAECGGLIYLGETLTVGDHCYPMVGALSIRFGMEKRPQGHGYTVLEVDRENPFFPVGTRLRGHEFHYSRILSRQGKGEQTAYRVVRGTGMNGSRDGMLRKNILAGFTHLHALGTPGWAQGIITAGRTFREKRHSEGDFFPLSKKDTRGF